jgi:DNA-binding MarR family transcriptional regulator
MTLKKVAVNNSHAARWKHEKLFSRGYLAVPISFLEHYANLKKFGGLTHAEAMFILQVMSFKWGERAPFPSYATLAKRMGTGPKTIQRQAKALEDKGYLIRQKRQGRSNAFELTPLFDLLLEAVVAQEGVLSRAA